MPPIHVIDFEGSLRGGIVEYGVATLDGDQVPHVRTRLCAARGPIRSDESRVHGLKARDLRACAPFSDEWALFSELRRSGVFAAHSAGAEISMLRSVWPFPAASPDWLQPGAAVADWGPWVDTERLARTYLTGLRANEGTSLSVVVDALGLVPELNALAPRVCPLARCRWHCAPFDALASALVLRAFLRLKAPDLRTLITLSAPLAARGTVEQPELF